MDYTWIAILGAVVVIVAVYVVAQKHKPTEPQESQPPN
jgi:hypothetical protein